jgi:hypothetical protein
MMLVEFHVFNQDPNCELTVKTTALTDNTLILSLKARLGLESILFLLSMVSQCPASCSADLETTLLPPVYDCALKGRP